MTSLRFVTCDGLITVDVEIETENFLELEKVQRDQIFIIVDQLHEMFDDFVDPAVTPKAPRKKRAAAPVKRAKKQTPPPAPEVDRPKIGDTRPAQVADLKQITKRLKGDGSIRWDAQIDSLFDGTCDRIVREMGSAGSASSTKHFLQNKDRRIRVDVVEVDGVTTIQVRRRRDDE